MILKWLSSILICLPQWRSHYKASNWVPWVCQFPWSLAARKNSNSKIPVSKRKKEKLCWRQIIGARMEYIRTWHFSNHMNPDQEPDISIAHRSLWNLSWCIISFFWLKEWRGSVKEQLIQSLTKIQKKPKAVHTCGLITDLLYIHYFIDSQNSKYR